MELATPITIYWDLPPALQDTGSLLRIAEEISICRPLMLQIYCDLVQPLDALHLILKQLGSSRIAISVTIPASAFHSLPDNFIDKSGARELLLHAEALTDLAEAIDTRNRASLPASLGISFSVNCSNWQQLPDLVSFCRKNGIVRLVLPMQRLYNNEVPFYITRQEQQELTDALAETGAAEGLNLTIHDPFLWRAFNPTVPFPQAGCQAANTMIAIAPDGGIYPCPTLPVRLGSIHECSLKEIIASPLKKQFRNSLLVPPGECRDCSEVAVCRGGCRGRGLSLQGTLDGLDTACQ